MIKRKALGVWRARVAGLEGGSRYMMAAEIKTRALKFQHALRLRMAEYWLALGQVEEALREFSQLPVSIRSHPEVVRMRARFECLPAQMVDLWLSNPRLSHRKFQKRTLAVKHG